MKMVLVAISSLFILCSASVFAGPIKSHSAKLFEEADVVSIKLAFMPKKMRIGAPLNSDELLTNGCVFESRINFLNPNVPLKIIQQNINEAPSRDRKFLLRNMIVLTMKDASYINIELADEPTPKREVTGSIKKKGDNHKTAILASGEMVDHLFIWAELHAERKTHHSYCMNHRNII